MIPKKIHYIWFGRGPKSERIEKCLESWRKLGYEIIEWNEDNFDVDLCDFSREAYSKGKWAYVADVARFWVLYHEGGIYMDTDVEVYKSLDEFLDKAFIGFEDGSYLSTAVIGAEKGNPAIKMILDFYMASDFIEYPIWTDYIAYEETSPCMATNVMSLLGLERNGKEQKLKHFNVYPNSYFHTKDEGYTYHSFGGSW